MPPRKHPLTVFRLKLNKTTVFLPVSSSTTLSSLRTDLIQALKHGRDTEVDPLPASPNEIALWRSSGVEGEETWTRLTDEKSTADKWGLQEAAEIGVSVKNSDAGTFPEPTVERPVDSDDEE
ncbi:BZ3500_MvSof-1268-A1-R1_Chr5-2g08011 [Microbotryum saponariae]|uniref:BZ3500_MvSof-1268-A1-R1_Chr5-2g08011 protein n=1 Tax=Microbotryum saponariae TaxID=289078 RepID=A0A2X0LA15_9BASI|nr:BZ3500_MvSof-1268-A1-R1_Chr5-2g08011 [Microbotryum saponariae]SDA05880.1 BZ3501_MvSof-1269-A2-R1_Chr5-2g07833 [Microbotryum saponariae]